MTKGNQSKPKKKGYVWAYMCDCGAKIIVLIPVAMFEALLEKKCDLDQVLTKEEQAKFDEFAKFHLEKGGKVQRGIGLIFDDGSGKPN